MRFEVARDFRFEVKIELQFRYLTAKKKKKKKKRSLRVLIEDEYPPSKSEHLLFKSDELK